MKDNPGSEGDQYQVADMEEFARNLVALLDQSGRMAASMAEYSAEQDSELPMAEMASVSTTLGSLARSWLSDPKRAAAVQAELMQGYMGLWNAQMRRLLGAEAEAAAVPQAGDRRFADPDWSSNQYFDFLKQAYLLTACWAEKLADEAPDLDPHEKQKAQFYVKQIVNALAPSNFVLTNPELLRETLSSKGANLVRGLQMLQEDIERGRGSLKIRQSDHDAFEVGRNLALTPGKVIFQNSLIQLIQYEPSTETVLKRPLLIVPPWINKYYVLDLTPEKSFIKWCVEQGHTVFVISWVNPDADLADKSWEDYVREGLFAALDAVEKSTGEKQVNAIGYCVGGTLLATALAMMANARKRRVASATFLTTQIDFTFAGDLMVFVDEAQIKAVEASMAKRGYLDASRMYTAFNLLRSNDLIWPYVVNNYIKGKAPFPFDLLYWNSDATRMPAANHSFYLRQFYLNNNLTQGRMKLGGKTLDLAKVKVPVYDLATKEDHIAPAKSAFLGAQYMGGPVRFVLAGSGHIAGVVNPPSKNKYQYWTGGPCKGGFEDWLESAEEHPGSWWPDWHAWAEAHDATRVAARKPGGGKLKPIEDAPGSYVRVRY